MQECANADLEQQMVP